MKKENEGWDSATVARLTKTSSGQALSVRQLQYWDRTKLLSASTREKKRKRLYNYEDILRLRIIVHLLEARLPVQKVRAAVSNIEKAAVRLGKPWQALRIVTDGLSVFVVDGDRALDALRNQFVSLVLLGDIEQSAQRAWKQKPARRNVA